MPTYKYDRHELIEPGVMRGYLDSARIKIPQAPWLPSFMAMLYIFGCRVSEATRIQVIDLRVGPQYFWAKVPTLKKKVGPPFRHLKVKKGTILLEEIQAHWEPLMELAISTEQSGVLVWPTNRHTVHKYLKVLARDLSAHKFRHNRLMRMAMHTQNPFELRDWAGWTSIRPAEFYIQAGGILAQQLGERVEIY